MDLWGCGLCNAGDTPSLVSLVVDRVDSNDIVIFFLGEGSYVVELDRAHRSFVLHMVKFGCLMQWIFMVFDGPNAARQHDETV